MRIFTEKSRMTKVKFASAILIAAIALSSTVASANDNKRARGYKSMTVTQDASSATAAQRSGATLQGGAADGGGGVGGG